MNTFDFTTIDFSQIYRLKFMLEEAKIPFDFIPRPTYNGYQIIYPNEAKRSCSVILHDCSCGHESGLLEIMGLLTDEEFEHDSVRGYLTAEDVFKRILDDWNSK